MSERKETVALVWFRNDLRIKDNNVLSTALKNHKKVIGIYCLNPQMFEDTQYGFKKTERFRARFLLESLQDLKEQLEQLNSVLLVYLESPSTAILKACEQFNISDIYLQKEWTQEEVDTETSVKAVIESSVKWHSIFNQFLFHPDDIQMDFKSIPHVFTNFRKHLEKNVKVRTESNISKCDTSNKIDINTTIPTLQDLGFEDFKNHPQTAFPFKGGETEALKRLETYFFETKKLGFYKKTRNGLIGIDYSSKFSPWLANGCLSARSIYWQIKQFEKEHYKNESTYWLIFELIWRDYFKYVSLKHGNTIFKIGGILEKDYEWSTNQKAIRQWINGETASDFVNANMLELKLTGWMSNRGRQNVASFFTKDLLLDWRIGAAYFEAFLLDYDVHSNYGNWMYVSGVGNDPRDRKFNVKLQAERYDSQGKFRRLWLQQSLFA